jgi:hypothetical protein
MSINPDELYKQAQQGLKLTPSQRRAVIAHLEEQGEIQSNYELAAIFRVDERVIRRDRTRLLRTNAKAIHPEQALLYIAAYVRSHDQAIAQCRLGLKKAQPGTPTHQMYLKLLSDLEERKASKLQSIGVIPKELGRLAITEEKWIAVFSDEGLASVHPDDGVEVKELEAGADPTAIEGETVDAD